jgi:hypothetical protein
MTRDAEQNLKEKLEKLRSLATEPQNDPAWVNRLDFSINYLMRQWKQEPELFPDYRHKVTNEVGKKSHLQVRYDQMRRTTPSVQTPGPEWTPRKLRNILPNSSPGPRQMGFHSSNGPIAGPLCCEHTAQPHDMPWTRVQRVRPGEAFACFPLRLRSSLLLSVSRSALYFCNVSSSRFPEVFF